MHTGGTASCCSSTQQQSQGENTGLLGMTLISARCSKVNIWLNHTISGPIMLVGLQGYSLKLDLALLITTSPQWLRVLWLLTLSFYNQK